MTPYGVRFTLTTSLVTLLWLPIQISNHKKLLKKKLLKKKPLKNQRFISSLQIPQKSPFLVMQKEEQRASGKPGGQTALLNQSSFMLKMRSRAFIPILTAWVPRSRQRPTKKAY